MSTITTDNEGFQAVHFPDNVEDYTIDDHWIVAAAEVSETVEQYWRAMDDRPSLEYFEVLVARHYAAWKHDEAGLGDLPF